MKKCSLLFSSFVCFTIVPGFLLALPQDPSVVAGDVAIQNLKASKMVINASDRAIIDYKSFDVHKGEKVQFVQPSSSACVLNRVKGENASKILGQIESNGKVILLNPHGMYFGPHASVRMGSLIASALDISNEDFIKGKYFFSLQNKDSRAEIRNDGLLAASPEGSIVLMAPVIRNLGTIQARAGKVVFAAGEQVTLDFHGDQLLQFTVEGDLKGAVIEHLGAIHAEGGEVSMRLPTAKRAIQEIINRDGMEKGEVFVKENGEIFLVSASSILAKKVSLEASSLAVDGNINVSSDSGKGGEVRLSGADITLRGAQIDASGLSDGGDVFIGGEYQGGGSMPYASKVSMDSSSHIVANAVEEGNGGNVVLWSSHQTEFDGSIFAQGGFQSGDGGSIETSSMENLFSTQGYVNTSAPSGKMGQWLLDPSVLTITGAGGANPGCVGGNVNVTTFEGSATDVTLCSDSIYQLVPITMTGGGGLIFTAPPGDSGVLHLAGGNIGTIKGSVVVRNMTISLEVSTIIDTTDGAAQPTGAVISLGNVDAGVSGVGLTLQAGFSNVNLGNVGLVSPLGDVSINAGTAYVESIVTESASIQISAPIFLTGDAVFSTELGGGATISLQTVDSLSAGSSSLIISAGTGSVSMNGVGIVSPLGDFTISSAAPLVSIGSIITQGGTIDITPSIVITQSTTTITTYSLLNPYLSANVTLGDVLAAVPGAQSLNLLTGLKGAITVGNLGLETTPLNNIVIDTNQPLSLGSVYAESLNIAGGSSITRFNGPINLTGDLTVATGEILLGAPITAASVSFITRNSILNQGGSNLISTIGSSGDVFLNALRGNLGSAASPLEVDTEGDLTVGGDAIYISPSSTFAKELFVPGNKPCLLKFKGNLIACDARYKLLFSTLPKASFSSFFFNPFKLGIGYPTEYFGPQFSPFAPLRDTLDYRLPQLTPI